LVPFEICEGFVQPSEGGGCALGFLDTLHAVFVGGYRSG